jgi:hypothetical protein
MQERTCRATPLISRADFDQNRHEMHCDFPSLTFFLVCGLLISSAPTRAGRGDFRQRLAPRHQTLSSTPMRGLRNMETAMKDLTMCRFVKQPTTGIRRIEMRCCCCC